MYTVIDKCIFCLKFSALFLKGDLFSFKDTFTSIESKNVKLYCPAKLPEMIKHTRKGFSYSCAMLLYSRK